MKIETDIEKYKAFVNFGNERFLSKADSLRIFIPLCSIFGAFSLLVAYFSSAQAFITTISVIAFFIITTLVIIIVKGIEEKVRRVMQSGVLLLFLGTELIILGQITLYQIAESLIIKTLAWIPIVIILAILTMIRLQSVHKGDYVGVKTKSSDVVSSWIGGGLGAITGAVIIPRVLDDAGVSNNTSTLVAILIFFALSIFFIMFSIMDFIKLYYSKKYKIDIAIPDKQKSGK
jgi:hypothetical protein